MTTLPAEPIGPTPRDIATYLRRRATLAARRGIGWDAADIEYAIAAAQLLELAFPQPESAPA